MAGNDERGRSLVRIRERFSLFIPSVFGSPPVLLFQPPLPPAAPAGDASTLPTAIAGSKSFVFMGQGRPEAVPYRVRRRTYPLFAFFQPPLPHYAAYGAKRHLPQGGDPDDSRWVRGNDRSAFSLTLAKFCSNM